MNLPPRAGAVIRSGLFYMGNCMQFCVIDNHPYTD